MSESAIVRNELGHFAPGTSIAGPGRPKGMSPSEIVRSKLEPHRDDVIEKIVELAKAGDPAAQRLYMTHLAPIPRQESERVVIPGLSDCDTPHAKADCILAAVAAGQISFEAGERALRMLGLYVQAITVTDHEARLRAIEEGRVIDQAPVEMAPDYSDLI